MNVTAKNIALISETANSLCYPLPFAFRQRIENRNRVSDDSQKDKTNELQKS
jgi:hypothetical protein